MNKDDFSAIWLCFNLHLGTNSDGASASFICSSYSASAKDLSRCREIRSRNDFHQLWNRDIRVLANSKYSVNDFSQLMWRDICCHPYCDTGSTVYKQVWKTCRQYDWFSFRSIVVILVVNGVFIDVPKNLHGNFRHSCLGVTHCCRCVPIDRSEVSMPIYKHVPEVEVLRHTYHRVVNGGVTMRVILPDYFPYDTGGFLVGLIRCHAQIVHCIQNTAMNWFQSVPYIRQGTGYNYTHGIVKERCSHFLTDIYLFY